MSLRDCLRLGSLKPALVAERPRILARHASVWEPVPESSRPEGTADFGKGRTLATASRKKLQWCRFPSSLQDGFEMGACSRHWRVWLISNVASRLSSAWLAETCSGRGATSDISQTRQCGAPENSVLKGRRIWDKAARFPSREKLPWCRFPSSLQDGFEMGACSRHWRVWLMSNVASRLPSESPSRIWIIFSSVAPTANDH